MKEKRKNFGEKKKEEYTLGFAFDKEKKHIALIKKNHPEWQKGCFNGIGGHREKNETPMQCMIREFEEETGYRYDDWNFFLLMKFNKALVNCYYAIMDLNKIKSITDEKISIISIDDILNLKIKMISNLTWIIPMVIDFEKEPFNHHVIYHYNIYNLKNK
jgi:8-oxo-dGTP diphosphatase